MADPVEQSLSPDIMSAAFALLGHDAAYVPFPVPAGKVKPALFAARTLGAKGFNISMPHKEDAVMYCDSVEGDAVGVGAVNTVVVADGRLVAHNTDAAAVVQALARARVQTNGARVLLLGAGGAARAAGWALGRAGAAEVIVANRGFGRGRALAAHLARQGVNALAAPLSLPAMRELVPMCGVLVNATSVGMNAPGQSPLPDEVEPAEGAAALDLVYRPVQTRFLAWAQAHGLVAVDGLDVLVLQAIGSLSLWLGRPVDKAKFFAPLRTAALEALARVEKASKG